MIKKGIDGVNDNVDRDLDGVYEYEIVTGAD